MSAFVINLFTALRLNKEFVLQILKHGRVVTATKLLTRKWLHFMLIMTVSMQLLFNHFCFVVKIYERMLVSFEIVRDFNNSKLSLKGLVPRYSSYMVSDYNPFNVANLNAIG